MEKLVLGVQNRQVACSSSETVKGRAKVTIDGLYKAVRGLSIAAKMYDLE